MITELSIRGFRSLNQVDVPLGPLTVLIGPNDTGKSSFIDALYYLIIVKQGVGASDHNLMDVTKPIQISAKLAHRDELGVISISVSTGATKADPAPSQRTWGFVRPVARFQIPSNGTVLQCAGFDANTEKALDMGEHGETTAALLDYLLRKERDAFDNTEAALKGMISGLKNILIETPNSNVRKVSFRFEGNLVVPYEAVSAGVRLCTFFAALANHPQPPRTILLEEPENGIHPRRLGDVMTLLRSLTTNASADRQIQVILTTHSPYLLDHVHADKDQVLVFRRQKDWSCTAAPINMSKLAMYSDDFRLGEIWANETEEGLVTPQ